MRSACPANVALTIEQQFPGGLDATHIAILKGIKASIPNADEREPGQILEFVAEAVRAHSATAIEASSDTQTEGIEAE
jgi:hypothetical protein